ncbi:acyltransferase family protein [Novosphingobium bradum]|uniref:Acyltransferase family protein n=1 Tax=Novosphingobium bradum TaxID=1737444 RepID=A0ABV7ING0_9SPHN
MLEARRLPSSPSDPVPARLAVLDGLRGVAAICVIGYHEAGLHGGVGLLGTSYLAVDFFFLLSGFVLTRAFEARFATGMTTAKFMLLRARRLYPLMALAAVIGAIEVLLRAPSANLPTALVRHLLFLPVMEPGRQLFELNGAQWSLLLELIANLAHVALLWRMSTRLVGLASAACAILLLGFGLHYGTLNLGWTGSGAWLGLARVGCSYGLGIVLARVLPSRIAPTGMTWRLPFALLPAAILASALVPGERGAVVAQWLTVVLAFPAIFLVALGAEAGARANAFLSWIGTLSFPLYAIHLPLLMLLGQAAAGQPASAWLRAGSLLAVLAGAMLLSRTLSAPRRPAGSQADRPVDHPGAVPAVRLAPAPVGVRAEP